MDVESAAPLERSVSQQSAASARSHRSATVRKRGKLTSQPSSSASSVAASDKSLTSFPSFAPDSPREERPFTPDTYDGATLASRKSPDPQPAVTSIVASLTTSSPHPVRARSALFEDTPIATTKVPGALHHADDEHISRLIARQGAVSLVRQIAEDLAHRDAQIATIRRKADERERALRKIILECGLSNLDLETRLRTIEQEAKTNGHNRQVSDLVNDAMADSFMQGYGNSDVNDATIRARTSSPAADADNKGTTRGWKDYLWGGGTSKKSSRASSINGDTNKDQQTVIRAGPPGDRRPTLQEDLFKPPEVESIRSSSRASSIHSVQTGRKPSLASTMLRLVAGGATPAQREGDLRGRANSAAAGGSLRTPSASSANTSASARAVSTQGGPKALMAMRRATGAQNIPVSGPSRAQPQDRWDTMGSSPVTEMAARQESYGPVEMDSILPPETQPPTLTHIYNNYIGSEYLTDRFGFIYDQRRKKRQREAAQVAKQFKRGSRTEMLTNGRSNLSPVLIEETSSAKWDAGSDERPDTPSSTEEFRDEAKPKRWQDYLKIATSATELLSHTPAISANAIEVMEGGEIPKSPGLIISEDRGFIPSASTTSAVVDSEASVGSEAEQAAGTLVKEDNEPVKLLLQQMSELHDSFQRDKTVRWNDFLRKVRAERRREGEVANATAAAAAEARFQRATAVMPEARLGDGEFIGIANWANKGKVGRAKWTEFRNLVLQGIPVKYRAKVWSECSDAVNLRVPGYYDDIVSQPEEEDNPEVVQQIRADINRTLTDNIFFRKGPGVQKLNEVLLAYSRRNPEVGYCQGMNLITANLLLVTPTAEDAFWILASIIERILPTGYYDQSLLASRADQQVLRQYVAEVLPKLSEHFDELGIALETMTFQWFLSVFTDCLSAEALFRVWDVVLCFGDGSTFLFQVALALLKLNEQQLLNCTTPAAVYTYINHQMTNHAISIDGLIQASEGLRRVVRREDVEARRDKAIEAEKELVRQREERLATFQRNKKAASAPSIVQGLAAASSENVGEPPKTDALTVRDPMPIEEEST
ncbi:putative tbc1 domain family member 10a protein [Phaeoacremonium minimum UCRPA7]|uniref:Putative tbc1 domain family member 10a protein n=1 Tax=Phaeoacremonium minimum (strain UCR-PA7) TaxID=1286976 RepID=R8BL79_PHAM7|nr:putative tbc1 domain family member 10a protein [Phaeoacremonium minimum UCRPA7]EOO00015.1 putative tbc1 domain family member 10a protein [Phaeoacremonium minimum UCRPA7]